MCPRSPASVLENPFHMLAVHVCTLYLGSLLHFCMWQAIASEPGSACQEPVQEPTGLPLATLQWVGRSICRTPAGFTLHPEVERLCQARR